MWAATTVGAIDSTLALSIIVGAMFDATHRYATRDCDIGSKSESEGDAQHHLRYGLQEEKGQLISLIFSLSREVGEGRGEGEFITSQATLVVAETSPER